MMMMMMMMMINMMVMLTDDDDINEMMLITTTRWYQGFKETWITAFPFHKPLLYFACWGRTRLEDDLPIEQVSLIFLLSSLEKLLVPFNRVYGTFSRLSSSDGDRGDVDGDGVDDDVVEQNAVPDSLTLN